MTIKKILTTDNLKDIKRYVTKNQDMTLDVLLEPTNKEKLLKANDNPTGGAAEYQRGEDKTLVGTNVWKQDNTTSIYQKYKTEVSGCKNISPIPMYLKRENMAGAEGTAGGTGQKGYTGCQYAASQISYNSSNGELTLSGLGGDYNQALFYYSINGWLETNYPNKTYVQLPQSINVDENNIGKVGA